MSRFYVASAMMLEAQTCALGPAKHSLLGDQSAWDRGAADAYYARASDPHKIVAGELIRLTCPIERASYFAAYDAEPLGRKEW